MHKTCCLPWEALGAKKSEAMSHLQCSREDIYCLPVLQAGIWLAVLCAFGLAWVGSKIAKSPVFGNADPMEVCCLEWAVKS